IQHGDHARRLQDALFAFEAFRLGTAWAALEVGAALEEVLGAFAHDVPGPWLDVGRIDPERFEAAEVSLPADRGPVARQVRLALGGARRRRGQVDLALGGRGEPGRRE